MSIDQFNALNAWPPGESQALKLSPIEVNAAVKELKNQNPIITIDGAIITSSTEFWCRGYGILGRDIVLGDESNQIYPHPNNYFLAEVFVPSPFWGNGIGVKIIKSQIDYVKGSFGHIKTITGNTTSPNALRSAYKACKESGLNFDIEALFNTKPVNYNAIMEYITADKVTEYRNAGAFGELKFMIQLR